MKEVVFITGASSGIGKATAILLAEKGYCVYGTARNPQESPEKYNLIPMDVRQESSVKEAIKKVMEKEQRIDILINNAGVGIYGRFSEFDEETMKRNDAMINLNIKAVVELTRLFLADMIKNGNGEILNVSSIAAFMPGPLMSTYYASKAFVQSFTEAVREEMRNDIHAKNIKISVLCPGPTATGFEKSSNLEESSLFERMKVMSAKKVAEIGYKEFQKGKATIIPGIFNRIAVFGTRFFSRKLIVRIAGKIQEKKKGS